MATGDKPSRDLAYSHPTDPSDYEAALALIQETGLAIRMKKIARLEASGLEPSLIAVELSKGDDSWTLDEVLCLMGRSGSEDKRSELSTRYAAIREEIRQSEMIDPDSDILELRSYALSVITAFLKDVPNRKCKECGATPKDGFDGALKVLKAGGVGLGDNVSVVEFRMDKETLEAMREVSKVRVIRGRLDQLIEAEVEKIE